MYRQYITWKENGMYSSMYIRVSYVEKTVHSVLVCCVRCLQKGLYGDRFLLVLPEKKAEKDIFNLTIKIFFFIVWKETIVHFFPLNQQAIEQRICFGQSYSQPNKKTYQMLTNASYSFCLSHTVTWVWLLWDVWQDPAVPPRPGLREHPPAGEMCYRHHRGRPGWGGPVR